MNEKIETESRDNLEILVKKDVERDISLIKETFQRENAEAMKNRILYFYKPLKEKLRDSKDQPKDIEDYFRKIYIEQGLKIDEIVSRSEKLIKEQAGVCLENLISLMEYSSDRKQEFIAIPTLLPYSPFNRPIFYFSIIRELVTGEKTEVLDIAIHEISHFLFFDIIKNLEFNLRTRPETQSLKHLFKEALTGMLLSEPELETLLDRKNYLGNPEVHFLSVKVSTGKQMILREYLRQIFRDYRSRGLTFSDFIRDEIKRMLPKAVEFHQKKTFWDENEQELRLKDSKLLEEYKKPIIIS